MQVPSTLYVCAFLNPRFKLTYIGPAELPLNVFFFKKFKFLDLERSRSTGEDLVIVLCGYVTMKMNPDDKFNVVISYKTSALLCWSDLKSLIGVDLSAWATAFARC